jgi:hypothetical protein
LARELQDLLSELEAQAARESDRCGLPIVRGTSWHLDHRDDKLGDLGVSHARCNVRVAAKPGNKRMHAKQAPERALNPPRRVASREW